MKPFRKTFTNQPFKKMLTKKIVKAEAIHKTDDRMKPFVICIFGIILLLAIPFVRAGFACGQITPLGNIQPQWMEVRIYYENIDEFVRCSVSPAENKFCCDAEAIPGFIWEVGEEIKAEIYNENYFTEPVSLKITGEGYDVFPLMNLKKAVTLNNFSKIIFGSSLLINASFEVPYTYVEIENNSDRYFLYNGTDYEGEMEIEPGMNYIKIIASGGGREFIEDLTTARLDYYNFNREIDCKKCKENLIKQDKEVSMGIKVNLSHYIEGMELREYVPVDFEILETDGRVEEYSDTHNVIIWNLSGGEVVKWYRVKSPKVIFFPVKYIFRTELENALLSEEELIVSRFFSFWSFEEEMQFKSVKRNVYSRISPETPLVVRGDNEITKLGIIPKKTIKNAELSVKKYDGKDLEDAISHYFLDSNIPLEDISKIFVEFRLNKSDGGDVNLYIFEDGWREWETILFEEEDENYNYYRVYVPPTKKIAFVGEKEIFWDF